MRGLFVVGVGLLVSTLAMPAGAQWDSSFEAPPSDATVAPQPPPAPPDMVSAPPPPQTYVPPAPPPKQKKVGFTWGLQLGVPVFLDVPNDIVRPGADLSFFGGADFGYFVIGGATGIGWNRIRVPRTFNGQTIPNPGDSPLTRIFISIPEFRVQIPDLKVVLPYVSGALDLNFWNFREVQIVCDFYWCFAADVYRFTPGFTGRAGMGFQVNKAVYIDVGLRYSLSGKGEFFNEVRWWLTPYVGVIVRRR
ncbi:MAG: hypothetical protein AAGF92_00315 [Myxococcota bacterium]